jgi:outer membrane protein TolC
MADDEYHSWSVGLEFRIPLFGDKKSSSVMAQVKQRKRKALLEMKAIEVALANAVDTTIRNIRSSTEQAAYSAQVAEFNNRLLEIELIRLKAGKSNSRMVLEKEEDFRSAKEAELEALINQKKAILELEMAEGSLLSRYRKDVMKEGL